MKLRSAVQYASAAIKQAHGLNHQNTYLRCLDKYLNEYGPRTAHKPLSPTSVTGLRNYVAQSSPTGSEVMVSRDMLLRLLAWHGFETPE